MLFFQAYLLIIHKPTMCFVAMAAFHLPGPISRVLVRCPHHCVRYHTMKQGLGVI